MKVLRVPESNSKFYAIIAWVGTAAFGIAIVVNIALIVAATIR